MLAGSVCMSTCCELPAICCFSCSSAASFGWNLLDRLCKTTHGPQHSRCLLRELQATDRSQLWLANVV